MIRPLLVFTLLASVSGFAQVDVRTIIQRSVAANEADWNATPQYSYFERDQDPKGGTRTFEVMMILGSPYQKLVETNGKPLSAADQAKEEQKLQQTIAQRCNENSQQRAQRIAKYERDRKRDHLLMDQLTQAFDFTLAGEEKLGPFEVYALTATPRPGYQPPNNQAKVLTGMEGKLWIDKQSFQWVRVEAQVIHPVSIEGFLAQVQPGTHFELEKAPVAPNVWLPKHFAMRASAKVLFIFGHNEQEDESYWGYHKTSPAAQPAPGVAEKANPR